ncbi:MULTISPECIES: hypothetical protein [unclassified Streptomyces]|uniref:hypothetical protein n=1 Tax=unclassified Streptomyces TaxID=2593676 RepID=UPI001C21529A|nr:hypothetical protein [Streptomyces sp. AC558_RSS880]
MIAQVLAPVGQVVHRNGIGDLEDDPGAYGSGQVARDVEAALLLVVVSDLQSGGAVEGVADHALAGREFLLLGHQCLKLGHDLPLLGVLSLFFFFRPRTVPRTGSLTWGFSGRGGGLRLILCSDQGARDQDEGREGESAA